MNSTGPIDSWNINPMEVGPIYPFAGWEWLMFVVCLACCVAFVVWKLFTENDMYKKKSQKLREADGLANALSASSPSKEK